MKFASTILSLLAGSTAAFGPSMLPVANRPSTTLNGKFEVCIASGPGGDYNGNLEVTMATNVRGVEHKENLTVNYSASSVGVHVYDTGDFDENQPTMISVTPTGGGSFNCGGIYVTNLETGHFSYYEKVRSVEIAEGETKEFDTKHQSQYLDAYQSEKFDLKVETGRYGIENLHVKLINFEGLATPVQNIGSFPENAYESVSINVDDDIPFVSDIAKVFLFKPPSSKPSELYHLGTKGDGKNSPRGDFIPYHLLNDEDGNWILIDNIHNLQNL